MPLLSFNHRLWGHDFLPLSRGGSIAFAPLPTTDLTKTEYRWIQHLMSSLVPSEDCCDQQQSQGGAFVLFCQASLLLLHLQSWGISPYLSAFLTPSPRHSCPQSNSMSLSSLSSNAQPEPQILMRRNLEQEQDQGKWYGMLSSPPPPPSAKSGLPYVSSKRTDSLM